MVHRRPVPAALLAFVLVSPWVAALALRGLRAAPGDPADGALGLRTNLAHVGALALVELDGPERSPCATPLAELAERWRRAMPGLRVALGADPEGRAAEVLVAGLGHPRVAALFAAARVPFEYRPNAPGGPVVAVAGELYAADRAALALTAADPARPHLPVTVVAGAAPSCARVLEVLAPLPLLGLGVWSAGEKVLDVPLSARGGPRWGDARVHGPAGADSDADSSARAAVEAELAPMRARLAQWFPGSGPPPLPEVRGHRTVEVLQRDGALDRAARFDRHHGRLDVLDLGGPPFDALAALAEGWLAADLGPAAEAWVREGAAVAAAGGVGGETLESLAAVAVQHDERLGGAARTLAEDTLRFEGCGALERRVRAGLAFQTLAEVLEPPRLSELWRVGRAALAPEELTAVDAAYSAARARLAGSPDVRRFKPLPARFTGVTLAAPARPDEAGFGTAAALTSLERLVDLGARVVLLPAPIVAPRCGPARSLVGDMALVCTVRELSARGVRVVLGVEALTGEHGAGPADTPQLVTVERWREAEGRLAAAVRHGAWLARCAGADALVLTRDAAPLHAVALPGEGPEPAWYTPLREAKVRVWQRLVAEAQLGGVPLAAIAPGPGSTLPVRDALAFVAVDLEPSLTPDGAPPPRDPTARAARLGGALAQGGAAVLVGFAGTSAAYQGTLRGRDDPAAKAQLLEDLAAALSAPNATAQVFLRHWRVDGRLVPRSEDVAQLAEDGVLRRLLARE